MKNIFKRFRKNQKEALKKGYMQSTPCQYKIAVLGVGCGGCNLINLMYDLKFHRDTLFVCDMDKSVLKRSNVKNKIQFGDNGLGAGNIPEDGKYAAEKESNKIIEYLNKDFDCVIIVTFLGGGFGTGASPIIARVAKALGLTTVAVVTLPFLFEGNAKLSRALECKKELAECCDALFSFNNQSMMEDNTCSFIEAFMESDKVMINIIKDFIEYLKLHPEFLKDKSSHFHFWKT